MKKIIFPIFLAIVILTCFGGKAMAYQIQDLPGTEVKGDVVLGPTKVEFFLNPGEKATRELIITNRTGRAITFALGMEDFKGSRDTNDSVVFLGEAKGPYSLKDWLKPEVSEFTLEHGQRISLPVEISIPLDADPGGHYGVVFAVIKSPSSGGEGGEEAIQGQISIVSRAGTLFFIRVNGEADEDGRLTELKTSKNFYEKGPISFEVFFENNGSVHLTPYGTIEIKNILGKKIDEIELDPWFVMPDSLRLRKVNWEKEFLFGKYTAVISINRGYQDIVDQKSVEFWVIPWKIVLLGLAMLILVIWLLYWLASKFEIKRKTPIAR